MSEASQEGRIQILFDRAPAVQPDISFVLLDWCVRESFHIFDYLARQTVARERYEIIWIEYYDRVAPDIGERLQASLTDQVPILDKWLVMNRPRSAYYHKHLMYNVGIAVSRGRIVMIGDSDAMFRPSFCETVIEEFRRDPNIILHLDEVRNVSRKYYPFNYPDFEELLGEECINWKDGKTSGLCDSIDPIHSLNYGACVCALREDLVSVGGADEHIDYLGHICGPYELTWRLVNAGKREVWHEKEFLFHTWHPGTDGTDNYLGPHDGRNVSTTALEARRTGRIFPLLENPGIRALRTGPSDAVGEPVLLDLVLSNSRTENWTIDACKRSTSVGRSAYSKGDYDQAIEFLAAVAEGGSDDSMLFSDLGWSYYFKARYDKARASFTRSLSLDSANAYALRGLGWTAYQQGHFREAISQFTSALAHIAPFEKSRLQETFRGRGWASFHLGNPSDSVSDFRNALLHTDPADRGTLQDLCRGLGWALYQTGNAAGAEESFRTALSLIEPSNRGAWEDAQRGYEKALEKVDPAGGHLSGAGGTVQPDKEGSQNGAPGFPFLPQEADLGMRSRLFSGLGWAFYHRENYSESRRSFDEALALDSANCRALCGRGWTRLQVGDWDEAILDFNDALQTDASDDRCHAQEVCRGRAWAYYRKRKFQTAVEDFSKALECADPEDRVVRRNIFLGRCLALGGSGRYSEALQDAFEAGLRLPRGPSAARATLAARIRLAHLKQWLTRAFSFRA